MLADDDRNAYLPRARSVWTTIRSSFTGSARFEESGAHAVAATQVRVARSEVNLAFVVRFGYAARLAEPTPLRSLCDVAASGAVELFTEPNFIRWCRAWQEHTNAFTRTTALVAGHT